MNNLKLAVGFALALVLLSVGLYLNSKPKADPQQPTKNSECLTQNECVASCRTIVEINNDRLKDAGRISTSEAKRLSDYNENACKYACKEIKNRP